MHTTNYNLFDKHHICSYQFRVFLSLFSFIYFCQVSVHEGTRLGVAFKFTNPQYSREWQTNSTWHRGKYHIIQFVTHLSPATISIAPLKFPIFQHDSATRRIQDRTALRSSCVGCVMMRCVTHELTWIERLYCFTPVWNSCDFCHFQSTNCIPS